MGSPAEFSTTEMTPMGRMTRPVLGGSRKQKAGSTWENRPSSTRLFLHPELNQGMKLSCEVMSSPSLEVFKQRPDVVGQRFPHPLRIWTR